MARKAAANVRRPEVSKVAYTRVRIWQRVGRVNTSANGWSKRSDSGERDMHPPPGEKSWRLVAISKRSSSFYTSKSQQVSQTGVVEGSVSANGGEGGKSFSTLRVDIWYTTG